MKTRIVGNTTIKTSRVLGNAQRVRDGVDTDDERADVCRVCDGSGKA